MVRAFATWSTRVSMLLLGTLKVRKVKGAQGFAVPERPCQQARVRGRRVTKNIPVPIAAVYAIGAYPVPPNSFTVARAMLCSMRADASRSAKLALSAIALLMMESGGDEWAPAEMTMAQIAADSGLSVRSATCAVHELETSSLIRFERRSRRPAVVSLGRDLLWHIAQKHTKVGVQNLHAKSESSGAESAPPRGRVQSCPEENITTRGQSTASRRVVLSLASKSKEDSKMSPSDGGSNDMTKSKLTQDEAHELLEAVRVHLPRGRHGGKSRLSERQEGNLLRIFIAAHERISVELMLKALGDIKATLGAPERYVAKVIDGAIEANRVSVSEMAPHRPKTLTPRQRARALKAWAALKADGGES